MSNITVTNLSKRPLTIIENYTLSLGTKFVSTPHPSKSSLQILNNHISESIKLSAEQMRWNFIFRDQLNSPIPEFYRPSGRLVDNGDKLPQLEDYIEQLKNKMKITNNNFFHPRSNFPFAYAISKLKSDDSIRIVSADKNMGLTILDKTQYYSLISTHLEDEATYKPINSEALGEITKTTTKNLSNTVTTILNAEKRIDPDPKRLRNIKLLLDEFKSEICGHFYILAKIHKPTLSARPIVSAGRIITSGVSKWISARLRPYCLALAPHILPDSRTLISNIDGQIIPNGYNLFSCDVKNMYPSIPSDSGPMVVFKLIRNLRAHKIPCNISLLPEADYSLPILAALQFILRNSYLEFEKQIFQQVKGVTMGTNCAPEYANLFMFAKEQAITTHLLNSKQILFFCRFMDDIFFIGQQSKTEDIIIDLNKEYSPMELETSTNTSVNFMDLSIHIGSNRNIFIKPHHKECSRFLYIPRFSFHSKYLLRGFIKSEFRRLACISTFIEDYLESAQEFCNNLKARGYAFETINAAFQQIKHSERASYLLPNPNKSHNTSSIIKLPFHPALFQLRKIPRTLLENSPELREIFPEFCAPMICWLTHWKKPLHGIDRH